MLRYDPMRTARVQLKLTIRIGEGDLQSGQQGCVEYGKPSASVRVELAPTFGPRCLSSAKASIQTLTIMRRMG